MNMKNNPKVSIVIPVYNGSDYLKEAIDSALAQTYKNIEVIVVNDGSNDGGKTEAIAKSFKKKIRYCNKINGGVASALNAGIRLMKGAYFSWLSHDDAYYPHKIERQIHFLKDIDCDAILYGDIEYIDTHSNFIRAHTFPHTDSGKFLSYLMIDGVHGCTVLVPKKCFTHVGMFNENLITTQDVDLWFRLGEKYRFIHIPEILIKSRIHTGQGSATMSRICLKEQNELYMGMMDRLDINTVNQITDGKPGMFYRMAAKKFLQRGLFFAAEKAFFIAIDLSKIRISPTFGKIIFRLIECIFIIFKRANMFVKNKYEWSKVIIRKYYLINRIIAIF